MATQIRINKEPLERLIQQSPQKAGAIITALAHEGEAYAKENMGRAGSPAPEGEFPGIRTGELKNSITVENIGTFKRSIQTDKDYAPSLELGSVNMGARPFMLPMAHWLGEQVDTFFEGFIE